MGFLAVGYEDVDAFEISMYDGLLLLVQERQSLGQLAKL